MSHIETLIDSVRRPETLAELSTSTWEEFLQLGRHHGISGRWYDQLDERHLLGDIAEPVVNNIWSDRLLALENERRIRWEANRVQHAFFGLDLDVILLKGGAYIAQDLSAGNKRLTSDLDILIPAGRLSDAESALQQHGWNTKVGDDYDDHYYRAWMHELPPMQHNVRGSWLDVHHNLLPLTSRRCIDASALISGSVQSKLSGFSVLCNPDMLIHSILHGFYGGEFLNAFRDVLDIHELISDFDGDNPQFWTDFLARVDEFNIGRPVYYALRYVAHYFNTKIPVAVTDALSNSEPGIFSRAVMDFSVQSMVMSGPLSTKRKTFAAKILQARSHWLKMPPLMLTKHLSHKYLKNREINTAEA